MDLNYSSDYMKYSIFLLVLFKTQFSCVCVSDDALLVIVPVGLGTKIDWNIKNFAIFDYANDATVALQLKNDNLNV